MREHDDPPSELRDCLPLVVHPTGTKPYLPSLTLAIKEQDDRRVNHLSEVGRKPRVGKMEKARVPRRFFV